MICKRLALCKNLKLMQHARTSNGHCVTGQQHNIHTTSDKYHFDIFSPHNRYRAVFEPGAFEIVVVVKCTSMCGCGCEFLCDATRLRRRLRFFDPSLGHSGYFYSQCKDEHSIYILFIMKVSIPWPCGKTQAVNSQMN